MIWRRKNPDDWGRKLWPSSCYYDVGSVLALVALVGALLTIGSLAHDKYQSSQAVAACQQYRDTLADSLERMQREGEPAYKIRFAQVQLQSAQSMCARVRDGEAILLDKAGRGATKEALTGLVKGQVFRDLMSAVDLAFDSTLKLSDAYGNTESGHQSAVRNQIEAIKRRLGDEGRVLSGDDLAFFIAATEMRHITERLREQGFDENSDVYVNVLRRYLRDFYLQTGETPPPRDIARWLEELAANRYGVPVEPAATTLTAVGTLFMDNMGLVTGCPDPSVPHNTVTLRFPSQGGEVVGECRVQAQCTWPQCGTEVGYVNLVFSGHYDAATNTLSGTYSGNIQSSGLAPGDGECVPVQVNMSITDPIPWNATLQGADIHGQLFPPTVAPVPFDLRLTGQ
ncbi:MAG: hypothetical protein ACYC4R_13530 [Anaerolineae bacterium]